MFDKKITGPLFKMFGSKFMSSKTMPAPRHDTIIEPFGGGAGYSLRYCSKQILVCESNLHIFKLWSWLINDATENDIREIPILLPEGTDIRTLGMSEGQALLLKNWQRTNNVGNCWTISAWGSKPGQWTANTRSRVSSEFHYIKHWKIFPDGFAVLEAGKEMTATWLIDPIYKYNYQYGCKPFDYSKLANLILDLAGHVIVCEAVCPKTGAVPTWLPFEYFADRVTSRRKAENNHHSREIIYEAPKDT